MTGGAYTEIAAPTSTTYIDTGRANGTTYYYVESASNATGESANSAEVSATPSTDFPVLPENDITKNYMGMNTWFMNDWDGSFAFVDAMKHARPWKNSAWNGSVSVDEYGWPLADASTVIFTGSPAQVNGTYKLVFKGLATVAIMWTSGLVSNQVYDSATNTGFSDARLYRPGYLSDGSVVFTTPFVNALKKTSVIRMMDWTATNANITQHWADRITPKHMSKITPTYTGPGGQVWESLKTNGDPAYNPGVAIEHQIQLCNQVHSDCWINVPPAADDDLRVYLEYANEVWNSAPGFQSFYIINDIVGAMPSNHPMRQLAPADANVWQLGYIYPAYRLAVVSDIFRGVYGDASMMNRVRPVLMTQQGNANDTLMLALNWINAYAKSQNREVSSYFYGAGGSAYYGSDATIADADRGNANLYFSGAYDTQGISNMALDALWASNFGLKRIAYEGGPSLDYYTQQQADAINLDPRMQNMIVNTHNAWSAMGGDLLVYYTVVGPKEWNFANDITDLTTPKYKGLDQLNTQARAAITAGVALPAEVAYSTADTRAQIRSGYWGFDTTCDSLACLGNMNSAGQWIALKAHSDTAFSGNLAVNGISSGGAVLKVYINGVSQGQVTLAAGSHLTASNTLAVAIPKGLVAMRLELVSGSLSLRSASIN